MDVRVFGGLRVARDGVVVDLGPRKQRFVLALLVIEANRTVAADRLTELLWDAGTDKDRGGLQAYISKLRRALEPGHGTGVAPTVLVRQPPGYRLVIDRRRVDVLGFEDLVADGRRQLAAGDRRLARASFDAAIARWHAPPLPDFGSEPVVIDAAARWQGLLGIALEHAAELHLDDGDADAAALLVERHVADFPLRERLHELLALALYRTGRQADALRVLEQVRRALVETAGLEPGEGLRTLERRILAQDPALRGTPTPAPPPMPSPTGAEAFPEAVLVGREDELARLRAALATAVAGRGGAVTIGGPAGIGKTALVQRFVDEAVRRGHPVAWARCPEGTAVPPYWPLAHAGRQLAASGAIGAELVPGAGSANATAAITTAGEPFLLAQACADTLGRAEQPVIIVLDDLHWADGDTLRVLTHLAGELRHTPALLITTARPLAAGASDDLVACTAELTRQRLLALTLADLPEASVAEWLASRTDAAAAAELADGVHARTGGNPLFVRELIELLAADGHLDDATAPVAARRLDAVPQGVQAVVRRRVGQLPAATQPMLSLASVLGPDVDVDVLADVAGLHADRTFAELAPALDAGVLTTTETGGVVRFSHALVGDALAVEVNAARAADIHAAAARSLARRRPDDDHAALVARHAALGAAAGTAALAATAAARAARLAMATAAHTDAARHWTVAAAMLERSRPDDHPARLQALREQARAYERADQMPEAQAAVVAAVHLARRHGDTAALGAAAAVLNHASIFPNQPRGVVDHDLVALLAGVIDDLPAGDGVERVYVMAALATELVHSTDAERRDRISGEAVAMARRLGDPRALAGALHARTFALKAPAAVPERKAVALEMADLAERHRLGDDVLLVATLQVALADYSLGDLPEVARRLPRCLALLDRPVGQALRSQVGFFRALFEVLRGRYADATGHAEEAYEVFRRSRPHEAAVIRLGQQLTIGHDLGGITDELLAAVPVTADAPTGYALAFQLYAAVLLFDLGRADEAVARLPLRRGELPDRPDDYLTIFIDVAAAIAAVETDDAEAAAGLLDRLAPWPGRWAAGGTAAGSLGLVELTIARLHASLGHVEAARSGFVIAVDAHERAGAPAWLARSLLHQARFLRGHGDHHGADVALDRAGALADANALAIVARQVAAARA